MQLVPHPPMPVLYVHLPPLVQTVDLTDSIKILLVVHIHVMQLLVQQQIQEALVQSILTYLKVKLVYLVQLGSIALDCTNILNVNYHVLIAMWKVQ